LAEHKPKIENEVLHACLPGDGLRRLRAICPPKLLYAKRPAFSSILLLRGDPPVGVRPKLRIDVRK